VFPQSGHEAAEGREASHELLNVLDVSDLTYFSDGRNLVGVRFDTALGDDVPQELAPGDSESVFLWVQLNVELPEVVEGFLQVSDEVVALSRFHDDIVDIDLQVAPYLSLEVELHIPLVCGPCVLQSKRHFSHSRNSQRG
jgi:hypothetical protein